MVKTSDEVKSQISPDLQKLMDDVLAKSDGRPLQFIDEQKYQEILGRTLPEGSNAAFFPQENGFVIILKRLYAVTRDEELAIAHEIGHLWLLVIGLPPEKRTNDPTRQEAYDTFFGPLREIIEHAVIYPWLKAEYKIDLYEVGKNRLYGFLTEQFPALNSNTQQEKLLLILNYLKYMVETDNDYCRSRLAKAYSKNAYVDIKNMAEKLLSIIYEPNGELYDPKNFTNKYCSVLKALVTAHFDVPRRLWPTFVGSCE